jgi:hypothetical protein
MSLWRWCGRYRDIGIYADGTLWNPNGYPEEEVRAAVLAADERRKAEQQVRRRAGAVKAVATRRRRHEKRVYETAYRYMREGQLNPSQNCNICGRYLTDEESIGRGIGSECWQGILARIAEIKAAELGERPADE